MRRARRDGVFPSTGTEVAPAGPGPVGSRRRSLMHHGQPHQLTEDSRHTIVSVGRKKTRAGPVHDGPQSGGRAGVSLRVVLLAVPVLFLSSCANTGGEETDMMVDVGTHGLHAVVMGDGAPSVVIDGGIGAGAEEYESLQTRLAAHTTVVAYDRAGYGESEEGPLPRDSATEAAELRALLEGLGIDGPHVLVGHSLGGLNIQVYAGLYPEDVAGLVLLDPPPLKWLRGERFATLREMAAGMTADWQAAADAGGGSADEGERARAGFFRMLASEHREMFDASADLAEGIVSYGGLPLAVIASGVPNPMFGEVARDYQDFWIGESRALASKSSGGRFALAEESTHRVHVDAQDLVFESILSVVEEAREKR